MKLWLLKPVNWPTKNEDPWDPWWDKVFGFVVREETERDLRARKFRLTDVAMESLKDDTAEAEFDARLTLMTLEVRRLLAALCDAFKVTP